jgi:hypothetical protein
MVRAYGKSNQKGLPYSAYHGTLHKYSDYHANIKTHIAHNWKGFASKNREVPFWEIQNVNLGVIEHKKAPITRAFQI